MKNELFYRSFEIDQRSFDENKREVTVSISSETEEVERWFGIEILSHNRGAVDLKRIKSVGAHLFNHDPNRIIGPVKSARIKDDKGYAVLGYDETEEGETAFIRMKNNSLRGISVRYRVFEYKELSPGEEYQLATRTVKRKDKPILIATKWEITDISSTPVPFDASVGVGRASTRSLEGIDIIKSQTKEKDMDETKVKAMIDGAIRELNFAKPEDIPKAKDIATAVRSLLTEEAKPKMRVSTETFIDLLGRAGAVSLECKGKISDMAAEGKTEQEMLRTITDEATLDPDAGDTGDKGNTLEGKKPKVQTRTTSFEQVEDKDFFGSVCQPSISFN